MKLSDHFTIGAQDVKIQAVKHAIGPGGAGFGCKWISRVLT